MEPDKRLDINLVGDKNKTKGTGSRNNMRKEDAANKKKDAETDTSNDCGFSTEQRINIENLNIRKKEREDRNRESTLVGLSIEAGVVSRLVQAAERRAEQRCPDYNATNQYWVKVDILLERESEVLSKIHTANESKNDTPATSDISQPIIEIDEVNNEHLEKKCLQIQ